MNLNPENELTPSINEEESQLLFKTLTEAPSFRHGDILANYLLGTAEEIAMKRERLETILMYFRNRAPRMVRFFFPPELADKTLELLHKLTAKRQPPKRKAKKLTLEGIFNSNAIGFKNDFKKLLEAKNNRCKTQTFQLTVHYFWQKKDDFPTQSSPLARLFSVEFGKQIDVKEETLRKGLQFSKNSEVAIPKDISEALEKYIK